MPTQCGASVHNPARARNIARFSTAQEYDDIGNLIHLRDAAHGHRPFHQRLQGRVGGDGAGNHGGVDPGGAEAVGADLVGRVVESCEWLGQISI